MSLIALPFLAGHAPRITAQWSAQLVGHIVSVGMSIVASIGGRRRPAGGLFHRFSMAADAP
jgi:hypothetical protein